MPAAPQDVHLRPGRGMNLVRAFWRWMTTASVTASTKGHPDLVTLDMAQIAKSLDLAGQARRLGQAGLPAADAQVPSGPEAAVLQRVEKARQDCLDWAQLRLHVLSAELAQRDITPAVNAARQADREFERQAAALLTDQDRVLRELNATATQRQAELAQFRREHGLQREARYPSPTGTYLGYALVGLLIVVEGVLNARFFAQGLDSGLLGGFTQAGILAAANVLIAFCFGKFALRYANHRQAGLKALGWAALATALAVMLAMAMGIAHYRDSLVAEFTDPARAALVAVSQHPLQLRDFFSWALAAISLAFGVAALFDGLASDDRYPGYGPLARRAQAALDDHEEELKHLRSQLEDLKDEALERLEKTLASAQAQVAEFEGLVADKRLAGARLATALQDAEHSLAALLGQFRTENELHRNGPRPAYFNSQPALQLLPLPDFNTAQDAAALAAQREGLAALQAEVQGIRGRIQAAFNQQFDQLKPLDAHFQRPGAG